jgi:uncharacterized protein YmfQ (DUF2313 family)
MSFWSSLTGDDFAAAQQGLLPRGRAWPRRTGSVLTAFCQALADCLFLLHTWCTLFLELESFPATANQLLPDFEADYGLPDSCSPAGATILQRRSALLAKIASSPGGQSAAYFIGVAAALGYTITITTWKPAALGPGFVLRGDTGITLVSAAWRFAWRVNAPQITVQRFTLGVSQLPEPLWTIGNTQLECRLRKIAPAYGVLWFKYS